MCTHGHSNILPRFCAAWKDILALDEFTTMAATVEDVQASSPRPPMGKKSFAVLFLFPSWGYPRTSIVECSISLSVNRRIQSDRPWDHGQLNSVDSMADAGGGAKQRQETLRDEDRSRQGSCQQMVVRLKRDIYLVKIVEHFRTEWAAW